MGPAATGEQAAVDGVRHQDSNGYLCEGEQVRFVFIRAEKANDPLTILYHVLKVFKSEDNAFEKWRPSKRERSDQELTVLIQKSIRKAGRLMTALWFNENFVRSNGNRSNASGRTSDAVGRLGRPMSAQVPPNNRFKPKTDQELTWTDSGVDAAQPLGGNDPAEAGLGQ